MFIDEFIKFEYENILFKEQINNFKYWHYIRKTVYDEILEKKSNIGQAHSNLNKEKYYRRIVLKLKQFPNWIYRNPFFLLKKKDILVLNHPRRVKNQNYYDCIYTDEILNNLDYSYYVFEQPILEKHFTPVTTKNLKYLDYLNYKIAINVEFNRKILRFRFSKADLDNICTILNRIEKLFEVNLNKTKILKALKIAYLSYKPTRRYYNKLLEKINPKIIIELVSYGRDRLIINELASEKGIPVIELQHGTMGKYHIAYNFAEKIKLPTFPDYIFVFGQFWKDNTRLPIQDDKVKVVGWSYFQQKVNEYENSGSIKGDSKKTILFISQGTIGKALSKIAIEVFKKLNKEKFRIIYKLHPGEYDRWEDEYPWLVTANFEVIDHNNKDMHHYFAQSDIQVGVASTALFEGLGYGLKTIVVKLQGHEYMEKLYNESFAELVDNSESLVKKITTKSKNKALNIDYFWKPNCIENFKNEVYNILEMRDAE